MGALQGRVAVVTGGGRGLGRSHALYLAAEGARVVVNDLGAALDGSGRDPSVARAVVEEIRAGGGEAVADTSDVADWESARRLVANTVEVFGELHVLVANAGNLRDRSLVNLTEAELDDVMRVHVKGHVAPLRWAAAHWRERALAGRPVAASAVLTTSTSGLFGRPGQAAYGAAKAGIAALTLTAAEELGRHRVRVNAVAPVARTRLTESAPGVAELVRAPTDAAAFDPWDPANVSPLVAWLATESCPVTGRVFVASGGQVRQMTGWTSGSVVETEGRWTVAGLAAAMGRTGPDAPPARGPSGGAATR
jgi:NAD(P)-dependent dehydrogenase (short-subunit alcohol dehydrogenase family)